MTWHCKKEYGFDRGYSVAFRQPPAIGYSHCGLIHGYSLGFRFDFSCETLDQYNWCLDFGSMKPVKTWLDANFDHKTLVAADDPELEYFKQGEKRGVFELNILPAIGCERFAKHVYDFTYEWMRSSNHIPRVHLAMVTVSEHGANSGGYSPTPMHPAFDINTIICGDSKNV